jgi:lipopolysaccharide biosynthesis regulator YciM
LLLLPIAAASGWWAARRSVQKEKEYCADRDPEYFRGLNYLLNEQPDKAIDVFIKLLEVDSETVETHLALGNLFRRRGEVDRAIRIHQNLIARTSLSREQRALALLELGQDYMRAGLLDRAESLFSELVEMGLHRERALSKLRDIYQQEKDWNRCLEVSGQLESLSGRPQLTAIGHYYCEQAEDALRAGEGAAAWELTGKALTVDRRCVRATLLRADFERAQNNLAGAVKTYKQVVQQDSDFLADMLPRLIDCYREMGDTQALTKYLRSLYLQQRDTRVMLAFADALIDEGESEAAERVVSEHIQQHADLIGLQRYIKLKRKDAESESQQETLDILFQLVGRLLQTQPVYQCTRCGFSARRLHWQCPGCKGWSTVRPVFAEGVESKTDGC